MFAEYPLPLNLMLSEKASVSNLDTVTANLIQDGPKVGIQYLGAVATEPVASNLSLMR